jgi:hypothetical protein
MRRRRLISALLSAPLLAAADPAVTPLPAGAAASVLGRRLTSRDGKEIGVIVDVLVDVAGRPTAAVVDVGGFLGVGARRVAIGWALLRFAINAKGLAVTADLEASVIASTPEYKSADAAVPMLGPAEALPTTVAPTSAPAPAPAAPSAKPP